MCSIHFKAIERSHLKEVIMAARSAESVWHHWMTSPKQFYGPSTLHLSLQKMQLHVSSIHITTFFHNYNGFLNSFWCGEQFSQRFFKKSFAVLCVLCKGLKARAGHLTEWAKWRLSRTRLLLIYIHPVYLHSWSQRLGRVFFRFTT